MTTPEEKMRKLFSERLGKMLKQRDINQTELSKILDVSESTVGKWLLEKAIPRMGIIQKLSDYFGVGKSYFLEEDYFDQPESNIEFIDPQDEIIEKYNLNPEELAEYQKITDMNMLMFNNHELTEEDKVELEKTLKKVFVKTLIAKREKDRK